MLRVEFVKAAEKGLGDIEKHIAQRMVQKMAYCLWQMEAIAQVGKRGWASSFTDMAPLNYGFFLIPSLPRWNAMPTLRVFLNAETGVRKCMAAC